MKRDLQLLSVEYISGSFKKNYENQTKTEKLKISLNGDVNLGVATDADGDEEIKNLKIAIKLTLNVNVSDNSSDEEIAKMEATYIFIFKNTEDEFMEKLSDKSLDLEQEEYSSAVYEMANEGYLNIKEQLESTFKRAKLDVTMPITLT